jgi:hypothetical protein
MTFSYSVSRKWEVLFIAIVSPDLNEKLASHMADLNMFHVKKINISGTSHVAG